MNFGKPDFSAPQPNLGRPLHLPPAAFAVTALQPLQVSNTASTGNRFKNRNIADDLEVHASIVPVCERPVAKTHNVRVLPLRARGAAASLRRWSTTRCYAAFACMEEANASPPEVRLHSMTLSALASTVGEIFSSSALAVLKLITNSNLVGCSTGKSAGFMPFKILDT